MTAVSRVEVIGDCTLYLGDCLEILPTLGKVDAVVTDPPYGIGVARGGKVGGSGRNAKWPGAKSVQYGEQAWDVSPVDDELMALVLAAGGKKIVFGGNFYALPPASCWLVWDKENGDTKFADCELAWTNLPTAVRLIRYLWNGFARANNEPRGDHPTQKPIGVMKWALGHLIDSHSVIDPFMGSGTTGVACVDLGLNFTGIEREQKYFDAACRRIDAAYKQPRLFADPKPAAKQEAFL